MRLSSFVRAFSLLTMAFCACTDPQSTEEPVSEYRSRLSANGKTINGVMTNGKTINGKTINGKTINGKTINGKTINGKTINGLTIENFTITGSELQGYLTSDQKIIRGRELIGASIGILIDDPTPKLYTFKIDDAYQDSSSQSSDIWWYRITFTIEGSTQVYPLCTNSTGAGDVGVFLLGSYWDETTGNRVDQSDSLTLACADGVLAKCTHIGYRPWATGTSCKRAGSTKDCKTVSLKDHHQACTRMLRADYCGDGVPHTLDGTVLDIFDYLQPPVQLREENWQMESRWDSSGASCLTTPRHPELTALNKKGMFSCKDAKGKERKLSACNPYETAEDKRGLIVSTFPKATHAK